MRVLGCRWGIIIAIIGFPILGRGIDTADSLLLSMASSLIIVGILLWAYLRYHHKANIPPQQTG